MALLVVSMPSSKEQPFKEQTSKEQQYCNIPQLYKKIIPYDIRMLNLSLNELKLVAKSRGIKGNKSMSKKKIIKCS